VETATSAKVALLIYNLGCGGAERVASILAGGLCRRGHEVCILTLAGPEEPFYPLPAAVKLVPLGAAHETRSLPDRLAKNVGRVSAIRRALHGLRPDVLIGFMTDNNVRAILAARVLSRLPCRVIVSERSVPALWPEDRLARIARRLTYPLADAVVPCGMGVVPWFTSWLPAWKVVAIQNPAVVSDREPDARAEEAARRIAEGRWVLAMGRLGEEKGFDRLLEAFARVPRDVRAGWRLGIIGEGELRGELERCIRALGLEGEAFLLGQFANPYPLLRAGKIFALSSRYEGFPNALTEAMACGMASVAFDCPTGPGEIIRQGEDGLLVRAGDVAEMSGALGRLMSDEELREELARRAPEVLERFSERRFLDAWETLVGQI